MGHDLDDDTLMVVSKKMHAIQGYVKDLPSWEVTHRTWGKGKSSSSVLVGDMSVPRRVPIDSRFQIDQ